MLSYGMYGQTYAILNVGDFKSWGRSFRFFTTFISSAKCWVLEITRHHYPILVISLHKTKFVLYSPQFGDANNNQPKLAFSESREGHIYGDTSTNLPTNFGQYILRWHVQSNSLSTIIMLLL